MIEFALVVPLFLLLLFALIDFARLEFSYVSLANATREMARTAAVPATCLDLVTHLPKTPCNSAAPPSAADQTTNIVAIDQSFKNYESLIISPPSVGTDNVTIVVRDRSCVVLLAAGNGPCASPHETIPPLQCLLPLDLTPGDPTYCAVPDRFGLEGGSVDVAGSYTFAFNPLFQNRLTGIVDASFMQQFATLKTTARAYIE